MAKKKSAKKKSTKKVTKKKSTKKKSAKKKGTSSSTKTKAVKPKTVKDSLKIMASRINARSREYGFDAAGEFYSEIRDWITTTCTPLDVLLWGGIPRGRIIDIHGDPSMGKSTLLEAAFIGNQRVGGENVCLVSEGCLDVDRMVRCGLDLNNYLPVEMDSLEEGTKYILEVLNYRNELPPAYVNEHPLVIGWDTLSNSQERALVENPDDMYSQGMASKARNVRSMFRTITPLASRLNVTILFLFQRHARIGKGMQGKDTDCGGGPKYNASLRMHAKWSGEKLFKPSMEHKEIGIFSEFLVVKSKVGPPPFKSVTIPIRAWDGIDNDLAMFHFLRDSWATDNCPVCGGKVAIKDQNGKLVWESNDYLSCAQCNGTGYVFHLIDGSPSNVCIEGATAQGNATQWRYINGWPTEEKITFKDGELKKTLDDRPGLRTWMAEQCWKRCAKPNPPKIHPVE